MTHVVFRGVIDTEMLKNIWRILMHYVDEALFVCTPDGWILKEVDPAHVSLVEVSLSKNGFHTYYLRSDKEVEIALDIDDMWKFLTFVTSPTIDISAAYDSSDRLRFYVMGENFVFDRLCLHPEELGKRVHVPKLNLPTKTVVQTENLKMFVSPVSSITDHFYAKISSEGLELLGEGDVSNFKMKIPVQNPPKEDYRSILSLEYFTGILKTIPAAVKEVEFSMGTNYPIEVRWTLGELAVHHMMAPRLEDG